MSINTVVWNCLLLEVCSRNRLLLHHVAVESQQRPAEMQHLEEVFTANGFLKQLVNP